MNNQTEKSLTFPQFLLDKLWEVYKTTDDRRRKAFYYLFSSMTIFTFLWISGKGEIELPLLKTKVDLFIALTLTPIFIFLLTVRYLYLCTHSIRSRITYFQYLLEAHKEEFKCFDITFTKLVGMLIYRDLTENLNIFHFPVKYSKEWDASMSVSISRISKFLTNVVLLLTVGIPIFSYMMAIFWFALNYKSHLSEFMGILILIFYSFCCTLLLVSPIYFYYRVKEYRAFFRQNVWPD